MVDELELLREVEREVRSLREPVGYESGATSHGLDAALKALDDWRAAHAPKPVPMCVECRYPEIAHGRNVFACANFRSR